MNMPPTKAYWIPIYHLVPMVDRILANPRLPQTEMLYWSMLLLLTKYCPETEASRRYELPEHILDVIYHENHITDETDQMVNYEYLMGIAEGLAHACGECFDLLYDHIHPYIESNIFDYYMLDRALISRGNLMLVFKLGVPFHG